MTHFDESQAIRVLEVTAAVVRRLTVNGQLIIENEQELHRAVVDSRDRRDWNAYVSSLRAWLLCAYEVYDEYLSAERTIRRLSRRTRLASNEQRGAG